MARVLIVDDARFIRTLLASVCARAGHEVVAEAASGDQAVAYYRQLRPDVVFMDLTMPGTGGMEALREIVEFDADARVVVCSAVNTRDVVLEALRSGARDFVLKPIKGERVLDAITRALGSHAPVLADAAEPEPASAATTAAAPGPAGEAPAPKRYQLPRRKQAPQPLDDAPAPADDPWAFDLSP